MLVSILRSAVTKQLWLLVLKNFQKYFIDFRVLWNIKYENDLLVPQG